MNFLDHDILYSDEGGSEEWRRLVDRATNDTSSFWRKYARRKMRRSVKQLLAGVRPRIAMAYEFQ